MKRSSYSLQTLLDPEGPRPQGVAGQLAPAAFCWASWLHEVCRHWHCHVGWKGSEVHHPTARFPDSPGQRGLPHRMISPISDLRKAIMPGNSYLPATALLLFVRVYVRNFRKGERAA